MQREGPPFMCVLEWMEHIDNGGGRTDSAVLLWGGFVEKQLPEEVYAQLQEGAFQGAEGKVMFYLFYYFTWFIVCMDLKKINTLPLEIKIVLDEYFIAGCKANKFMIDFNVI